MQPRRRAAQATTVAGSKSSGKRGKAAKAKPAPKSRAKGSAAAKAKKPAAAKPAPSEHKRRARVPERLPEPPKDLSFYFAKLREGLNGRDPGEVVAKIVTGPRWANTVGRYCAVLDEQTASPQKRAYTSLELESMYLIRHLVGKRSYRETRDWLTSDRGATARRLLGFNKPREEYGKKKRKLMKGIPSEASMTRHHQRFPEEERQRVWRQFFEAARLNNLRALRGSEELLFGAIDGTALRTHYRAPVFNSKTGELATDRPVTAPDAGFKPPNHGDPESGGDGWQGLTTLIARLPMIYEVDKINKSEPITALGMLRDEWDVLKPFFPAGKLPIVDTDAGFHHQPLRAFIHEVGAVPRIHHRSHSDSKKTKAAVEKDRNTIWKIDGYPNWRANSLRQIFCVCGEGRTFRRFDTNRKGAAITRVEGQCKNCGPLSVTAGEWRATENPREFRRCVHPQDYEDADWSFGNPLWYDDPLAKAYGKKRFGAIEGFHGMLERRFGLNKGKRWWRRRAQAKLEVTMIYGILHELAIIDRQEGRARSNGRAGPP